MKIFSCIYIPFFLIGSLAIADQKVNFKSLFKDQDGCFIISNLKTGKIVTEFNQERCKKRFSPYSSFKIPAALMAFEKGIFKDENHVVKWDSLKRLRVEENSDQTPLTFVSNSIKWITEWIMSQVGLDQIKVFLKTFNYGNKNFSGGPKNAWVSSSLKISAYEQVDFLTHFWNGKLGLSERTTELTKKLILVQKFGENTELYGKTGTGCLVGNTCLNQPGKMIGWFVGVLKTEKNTYVFAGNASDFLPQGPPAGPRMRKKTIEILKKLNLITE